MDSSNSVPSVRRFACGLKRMRLRRGIETPVSTGFWRQLSCQFRRPKEGEPLAKDVERAHLKA